MLFRPKLPITTDRKTWIEISLQRLIDAGRTDRLINSAFILPGKASFPQPYIADVAHVNALRHHIANLIGLDAALLELEILGPAELENAGIQDGQMVCNEQLCRLTIDRDSLSDSLRMVALLARSLVHASLLKCGYADNGGVECPGFTDVATISYGFGFFMAGATIRQWYHDDANLSQWKISKQGSLSAMEIGYVLALIARLKSEPQPKWQERIFVNARETMIKSLRYLNKTGDCLLSANAQQQTSYWKWKRRDAHEAIDSKHASFRLAGLWWLDSGDTLSQTDYEYVLKCVRDKDVYVRQYAFYLLQFAPTPSERLSSILEVALSDSDARVRSAAVEAVGIFGDTNDALVWRLKKMLKNDSSDVTLSIGSALVAIGVNDNEAANLLMEKIQRSLVRGTEDLDSLLQLLRGMRSDYRRLLDDFFQDDPDLFQALNEFLED